jgi:hypothetical protein
MDLSQQPFLDDADEPDPELNRITNAIIGACIEVHRHLGAGSLEAYYEQALDQTNSPMMSSLCPLCLCG